MPPRYVEPGRTYVTSVALFVLLAVGFVLDLVVIGGGASHLVGWVVATVVVVGLDLVGTAAARMFRTITVDDDEVRVGEDSLPRKEIVAIDEQPDDSLPVLGRRFGDGVPRGMAGIALQLTDGSRTVVATRRPDRFVAALGVGRAGIGVRPAEVDDLALLAEIEERAGQLFRVYGAPLPDVPYDPDALRAARAVFVAARPPVGFVQLDELDGCAHVRALAVLPSHMRRGLGTALLEAACDWAADQGYGAVTLTAYADIPWNAPFFAARGFAEVDAPSPALLALRDAERAAGLDATGRRCVMSREV